MAMLSLATANPGIRKARLDRRPERLSVQETLRQGTIRSSNKLHKMPDRFSFKTLNLTSRTIKLPIVQLDTEILPFSLRTTRPLPSTKLLIGLAFRSATHRMFEPRPSFTHVQAEHKLLKCRLSISIRTTHSNSFTLAHSTMPASTLS